MNTFQFAPIGVIHSPYKEKFAIPRQPGLIRDGGGELELLPPYNQADTVRGLEGFSHLWVIFVFHQTMAGGWRPTVRPPRLGGNTRVGVFATRSTFRPNPIGMSLVELQGIEIHNGVRLRLGSLDLVDGTPVLDIKPYLPFAESQPQAQAGFAQQAPAADMPVVFMPEAEAQITQHQRNYPHLARFIRQVLAQDPRPAYRHAADEDRVYAVHLLDFNLRWRVKHGVCEVIGLDER
ncbi:tRNA (N6-threonylcarbamoyladenosine(37)-N6)-methyltransferase TrmO [Edwardsiella tarda]|uniref:tRNA (N6-threonylcarbamoyladenosine(37)-N6)-methyltransferase TrmO n=1 Tax=Edwardsiella tarda TaxID=636 RepID=UPI000BE39525|nr:tRNA (N6-threonylcarbamoyladenosine(37)-N6)-methyltransferase TrmO [Edwardsiella tarda]ATI63689.1 tRNA (N6-threonylcarbamoyladenosine(37)-N6)-methyltransferase TrmO [Edwardsiella tarda]UCQ10876.1 tRNA (N6-threonylcarbamoyladenosine(37)-N6)-methyltransferase TrmO [Edwardsiella tarda]